MKVIRDRKWWVLTGERCHEWAIALDKGSYMHTRLPFTGCRIGQESIRRDWGHRGHRVNRQERNTRFRLEVLNVIRIGSHSSMYTA